MSFLDDLRSDLKALAKRMDAEDPCPEYVMLTPDLKRFAAWFEDGKGKQFAGMCNGYRVIEDRAATWPFMLIQAKMLEAPKTLMEKNDGR